MDHHPSLYDRDILAWSEEQAAALRRLKASRRDLPNELDLDNIVEEIESVGRSQLSATESFLRQLLVHLVKLASQPDSDARFHWAEEILNFQADAQNRFAPSMAQHLDLDRIWRKAVVLAEASLKVRGEAMADMPETCPFSLDDLLSDDFTVEGALEGLRRP